MVIQRGEIWWANLSAPDGSEPRYRRPMVIVQSNDFNRSRINTVIAAVITSNLKLTSAPGNILLKAKKSKLSRDSVINVSQLFTVDRSSLSECIGKLTSQQINQLDDGLRLALAL